MDSNLQKNITIETEKEKIQEIYTKLVKRSQELINFEGCQTNVDVIALVMGSVDYLVLICPELSELFFRPISSILHGLLPEQSSQGDGGKDTEKNSRE